MEKPSYIPIKEVLRDRELSFLDKVFYLGYLAALLIAVVLIARTFWLYKELDLWGLVILIFLFLFQNKFHRKYTAKYQGQYLQYIQETQGQEAAALEEQRERYVQEAPTPILKTAAKAELVGWIGGIAGLALIFATIFALGPTIGSDNPTLFIGILILEFVLIIYIVCYRILWRKMWKPVQTANIAYLKRLKIPLRDWVIAILIVAAIIAIVFYRLSS